MADALVIPGAVELGGEDSRAGAGTKDTQIENKNQTVDNGYAAHRDGANLAYHNIIQQVYKVCNACLNDDGNGHAQNPAVKGSGADETLEHKDSAFLLYIIM